MRSFLLLICFSLFCFDNQPLIQTDDQTISWYNSIDNKWECKVDQPANIPTEVVDSLIELVSNKDVDSITDTSLIANTACHCHILGVHNYVGEYYSISIDYYNKAIELREKFSDGLLWKSYKNLGIAQRNYKTYFESVQSLENAKDLKLERPRDKIDVYRYLAQNYSKLGDFNRAIENAEQAINVVVDTKRDSIRLAAAYLDYSNILIEMKDTANMNKAIEMADQAILHFKDEINKLKTTNHKGIAYRYLKQYSNSHNAYEQAIDFDTNKDKRFKAEVLTNQGILFNELNKPAEAIISINTSLGLKKEFLNNPPYHFYYAPNYNNLGKSYAASDKLDQALMNFHLAIVNISNNFRSDNIFDNPEINDELYLYNNIDFVEYLDSKGKMAFEVYQQNGDQKYLDLANDIYETVFNFHSRLYDEIITEKSRLQLAETMMPYIENALKVQCKYQELGKDFEANAFKIMELNKATVLMQSINESEALKKAGIPKDSLRKEKGLRIKIAELQKKERTLDNLNIKERKKTEKELSIFKDKYDRLIRKFEKIYPAYKNLKYQPSDLKLNEVQNQLTPKTAIVEFFLGDKTIYVMTIQKEQVDFHQVNKPIDWKQKIKDFTFLLDYPISKDYKNLEIRFVEQLDSFYQLLFEKSTACLNDNVKHIQIVPDAELNNIPFAALITEPHQSDTIDFSKLNYLAHHYTLSYSYSTKLLLKAQKEKDQSNNNYNYGGFIAQDSIIAQYCGQSANYIPNSFQGKLFREEDCTINQFKENANQYDILSLTMHGCGKKGTLTFTDGNLRNAEIYNINLTGNQLIYLTACGANTGTMQKGEGIMSLSRAFTYAGSPSLVSTIWSVHPESTCIITNAFFEHLIKGRRMDETLWEAQKAYITNIDTMEKIDTNINAHPYYWAGIIPIGKMNPIEF